jgi:hypothetical protein
LDKVGSARSSGAQASTVMASQTLESSISCVSLVDFTCHSRVNVVLCGHVNGCMSVWSVRTELDPTAPRVRELEFQCAIVVEKGTAITALLAQMELSQMVVGLTNGEVICFGLPQGLFSESVGDASLAA